MLSPKDIQRCVFWACQQEVSSPKPGNVNPLSNAHNMALEDFIKSAEAVSPILANPDLTVGQKILHAIEATRTVVGCNTNLGIVLLFAPLCKAVERCQSASDLPESLDQILSQLTTQDASLCFQAIRLAEAGGMGESKEHDINAEPNVTLLQAMQYAQNRDSIAKQYAKNYPAIFHIGLPNLTSRINCGESVEWATAFAYLKLLSTIPDTLISRKYGLDCAESIMNDSITFLEKVNKNTKLSIHKADFIEWDEELKQKAINPGTTADMAAATLLVFAFQQMLSKTEF